MLKPAYVAESSGISLEKKVREMRASPFNKKSGSILSKANTSSQSSMAEIDTDEEVVVVVEPKSRPQRANMTKKTYVISDSETEEDAVEYSDFEEDED
ncbi:hypothetical protein HRI_001741600 [Hibiscus trionum]|uniref:Uncharacterized protein n=1 Tax=Hibiscus trionum TaxID=183268 RepID=A0A9W7HQ11_HIBTR|nr:hypothetical protein HRI_001741600 [Hibiscus trionum]